MATIRELDFKILLKDDEFERKINDDIQLAEKLNMSLSKLLDMKRQVGKISQDDILNNRRSLQMRVDEARAEERIRREVERTNREHERTIGLRNRSRAQVDAINHSYLSQHRILGELKNMLLGYLSIQGARQFLSSMVRVTGEFEMQKTTLSAMLGDIKQAELILSKIEGLAVQSPFEFKDLTTYAKQLSAFSVPVNELYDTTKMLADISAGLGVGMDRIILAYGQVRSAAFLRGQEVRQFTEAGIPILTELAKQFSELEGRAVSAGEVFDKISARLVPFEMVAKVFKDMTSEGGKFYKMQEIQAETLKGKISNLNDAYDIMLKQIGDVHSDKLEGMVDWAKDLMKNWEHIGKMLVVLASSYGIARVATIAFQLATERLALAQLKLAKMVKAAWKIMASNPYVAIAAAVAGLVAVLYQAITAQSEYEKIMNKANKAISSFNNEVDNEKKYLQYLLKTLEKLTVGTREYNDIKNLILQNYRQYLTKVDEEELAVGNLAGMYDRLSMSIEEVSRQKALAEGNKAISEEYISSRENLMNDFKELLDLYSVNDKAIRQMLSDYVRGTVNYEALPIEARTVIDIGEYRRKYKGIFVKDKDYSFEAIRTQLSKLIQYTEEARTKLSDELNLMYGPEIPVKQTEEELSLFVKTVQDTLAKFGANKEKKGIFSSLWAEPTTEYYGYLDEIRKRYQEIDQQIKDVGTTQKENLPPLEKQKEAIEAIADALGILLTKEPKKEQKKGKSQEQKTIEGQIDALKKLHDLYMRFKELGVPDDILADAFKGYFPDLGKKYGEDFITQQNYLERAIELARELGKYDKETSQKFLTSFGADSASKDIEKWKEKKRLIDDASKAARQYYEALRKWSTEDFSIGGDGVTFDMEKIASNLRQSLNEIDLREQKVRELFNQINVADDNSLAEIREDFEKEFGEGTWDKFYAEFLSKGEQAFIQLAKKQKTYETKLAQEKLNDLARKYLKEVYKDNNIDLSDFGDKSLSQIKKLRQKLQNLLVQSPITIPIEIQNALKNAEGYDLNTDSIANVDLSKFLANMKASGVAITEEEEAMLKLMQVLNALGLSFEKFGEIAKGVMQGDITETTYEEAKKTMAAIKALTGYVSSLGDTFVKLGEATDNDFLSGFGKGLSSFKEISDILTECESLTGALAEGFAKSTGEIDKTKDAMEEAAEAGDNISKSSDWVTMILKLIMLFITKIVEGISGSAEAIKQAKEDALEYARALDEIEFEDRMAQFDTIFGVNGFSKYKQSLEEATSYMDKIKKTADMIAYTIDDYDENTSGMSLFAHLGGAAKKIYEFKKMVGTQGEFIVDKRTGWQKFWGSGKDQLQHFNISEFFDEEGKLMTDKLKAFYDNNQKGLDDATKQSIEDMLYYGEQYEKVMQELNDYVSSIFSQLATDIVGSMVNSFLEIGDSAAGLEDVFKDLGQTITKSLLESFIIDNVLKKYQDKAKELFESSDGLTDNSFWKEMSDMFVSMKDELQDAAPYVNELLKYLQSIGMMPESDNSGGSSLGDGIKNITEDTANLLASYVNAIRADVSYAKTLWMSMDANTQRIASMVVMSVPNLMEYQAQIAANTFETASATKGILNELLEVFTYEGGNKAVRVYS